MLRVLGILRKSPTKVTEVSLKDQKHRIEERIRKDYAEVQVVWAEDVCEGDNEHGRVNLLKELSRINEYDAAYCLNVDRFSRSWLGVKWLQEYFLVVPLRFVEGMPEMYDKDGQILGDMYLFFFMQCAFANYELMRIRSRTRAGIDKLSPEERQEKYRGRPKGAKDRKKRKSQSPLFPRAE